MITLFRRLRAARAGVSGRGRRADRLFGAGVLLLALVVGAAAANNSVTGAKKEEGFQTAAPYAILIDAETGTVLYEKGADVPSPPSSLLKLMTAEVVFNEIKSGRITADQEFMVSEDAWRRGGAPSHTSSMFAPIHSRVRVEDLLRGLIIQSGNDAAIALAEGIGGNERSFAQTMVKRARELGLTRSTFGNATGLPDPANLVTMRELAKLAQHIIKTYPDFYPIYGEREFTWNKIRQLNRNPLLPLNIGADGMKTGFTADGGYGLVGSAQQNGLRLIVAINGLKTAKDRADEGKRLLDWGFSGFEARPLFADGQIIGDAKVFGGAQGSVPLIADKAVSVLVPKNTTDRISARIVYTGPVRAPVAEGQAVGKLRVLRGDNVTLEVPLKTSEAVEVGNLPQRAMDVVTEVVIGWIKQGFARI
ncbi:D-alanyl-D-alanine carboxypeptidase family protein [Rhodoplanes roseus]|uniref:serine-type D-Ala-D-Ala carboxypeptidase n=1 Tax=Rhodoplanes roseus TaxID=29409 RepID=A0A327KX12_9BRAD|nr:D-alanyl-D-alanine carboxypeptidase family protein [Rhodoplanes roseus]RAI43450.1 D-alanyl-D-alanine carboxypeptidase [Rhodoplanes roseus]